MPESYPPDAGADTTDSARDDSVPTRPASGCIEAEGFRDRHGYGRSSLDGRREYAHRAAWIEAYGPIPKGLVVYHLCNNRGCVNLEHLRCGTRAECSHITSRRPRGHRSKTSAAERRARVLLRLSPATPLETPCIPFSGFLNVQGYGVRGGGGQGQETAFAHRAAYEKAHGPIPAGMLVTHRCDFPPCTNVDHLELGTQKENMGACSARGRIVNRSALPARGQK